MFCDISCVYFFSDQKFADLGTEPTFDLVTEIKEVAVPVGVDGGSHLIDANFETSEDIEKIYELARESGKNYTLAKELEKHYLMECCIEENYDMVKDKEKNEEATNVEMEIDNVNYEINDEAVDMNYLTRSVIAILCGNIEIVKITKIFFLN